MTDHDHDDDATAGFVVPAALIAGAQHAHDMHRMDAERRESRVNGSALHVFADEIAARRYADVQLCGAAVGYAMYGEDARKAL